MPDKDAVDLTVECGKCGDLNYYNEDGKLVLPCGCCPRCKGSCLFEEKACYPCAGTGRRLAGSEDITAVERKPPQRAPTPQPDVDRPRRGRR
jgi:hypothetical protein